MFLYLQISEMSLAYFFIFFLHALKILYFWCNLSIMPSNVILESQIWKNDKVDSMEGSRAETMSWCPKEMYFTLILWQQSCCTWPEFRRWSFFFFIFSVHTRWYWCAWPIGSSRCADFFFTWGKSYSYSCGWTDAKLRELTGEDGRLGLMRRDVSSLPSSPLSHIKGLNGAMKSKPYSTYVPFSSHTQRTFSILIFCCTVCRCMNKWLQISWNSKA